MLWAKEKEGTIAAHWERFAMKRRNTEQIELFFEWKGEQRPKLARNESRVSANFIYPRVCISLASQAT